jgi:hypothetical protein
MSQTRYGMYSSDKKLETEIKNIQMRIAEIFDTISILLTKSTFKQLSIKNQKIVSKLCTKEKVKIKAKGEYLINEDICDNLMKKNHILLNRLEEIMPKKHYDAYCSKIVKEEFNKQSIHITTTIMKRTSAIG